MVAECVVGVLFVADRAARVQAMIAKADDSFRKRLLAKYAAIAKQQEKLKEILQKKEEKKRRAELAEQQRRLKEYMEMPVIYFSSVSGDRFVSRGASLFSFLC